MKTVYFVTPTQLSSIDLTTMGGSEKLGDESKIGAFCTGLKFSLALFLRHNVEFEALVIGNTFIGGRDRDYSEIFTPYIYHQEDELTGKSKELVGIDVSREFQSFNSVHSEDIFEAELEEKLETGVALKLGWNWQLWMGLREIYSNMLDEGGYYTEDRPLIKYGTVVSLSFEEGSDFDIIWNNRSNYVNEEEWAYTLDYSTKAKLNSNDSKWLKIYKQDILVFEDKETYSEFSYLVNNSEIDERRLLVNASSVKASIRGSIVNTDCKEFLRRVIKETIDLQEKGFLEDGTTYYGCSGSVIDVMEEVNEKYNTFQTYPFIKDTAKKHSRYNFEGRTITTVKDSLWNYSKDVVIETRPEPTETVKTLASEISSKYDIDFTDIEVQESELTNSSVIADKFNKRLIIGKLFDIEKDMPSLIVEYITLKSNRNIITELSERLIEKLKL